MGLFTVAKTKTSLPLLAEAQLEPIGAGKDAPKVLAKSLWATRPALIVLVRRPGCLLCRNEAHGLAAKRDLLEKQYGIRMVAVVNQEFGAKDFVDNFWKGEAYFDRELGLFKAMGDGQVRRASLMQLMMPSVISRMLEARKSGLDGNLQGDGTILGGLLILKPGQPGEIAYEYDEREFGDHAPEDQVLSVCERLAKEFPITVQATA